MNMDTVINKLRSTVTTVTSTVSQLSVVLPGNPVTREYEVNQHIASGGPGLFWKIYSGCKKSTKQEAAIFVFEKRQLDKWSRKDRDLIIEILKKGVLQLTKLRHPRILTVQHPMEESRDSLAFATEPVFSSLANVLGYYDNMTLPIKSEIKNYKLHEIEIKYGLIQICDGLTFLHNDAKMLHGNICPESIIINQQGAWKIFGLDFSLSAATTATGSSWTCKEYDSDTHHLAQQNLDYLAPEYAASVSCSPASDIFSLGLLTYCAFNEGKPFVVSCGNWSTHRQNFRAFHTLSDSNLQCIPTEMRTFEKRLLKFNPNERPDSHEFSKLEYLHDEGVKTLNYLDSLFQWDNLQKSKFYKGLSEILPKLPHRVRIHRVIPCLAQEFVNPSMVPFVLPNVLKIAEWASDEEYVQHILPYLKDVMKLREPVQVLFIFMKYMELLLQKTPPEVTKSDVLPLIYGSLESDSIQVQELCLSIIPSFASLIDYPAMKNSLLPRIRKLCISSSNLSVRVNCLVCLGKILDSLDKWLVMDFILPFLMEIPSREPAIIMGIIGIYRLAVTHRKLGVTKEVIATKVLPFVFPLCIENGLTTLQFSTIMNFIHEMVNMVETEHRAKVEAVSNIAKENEQMKSDLNNYCEASNSGNSATDTSMFGGLSLTSASSQNKGNALADFGSFSGNTSSQKSESGIGKSSSMSNTLLPSNAGKRSTESNKGHTSQNNGPRDLTSTLIESNLNQMGGASSSWGKSMSSSTSMPSITRPMGQAPRPDIYNNASNSMNQSSFGLINPVAPSPMTYQSPTMFNLSSGATSFTNHESVNSFSNAGLTSMKVQQQQHSLNNNTLSLMPRPSSTLNEMQSKHIGKSLTQRDIDEFLR